MRTILLLALAAACGSPQKPKPAAEEGTAVPATCCCKYIPTTSENDEPTYEMINRMECSTHQGECEPDVQCNGSQQAAPAKPNNDGVPPPPPLEPSTSSTP